MKRSYDGPSDRWLKQLDALVAGETPAGEEDTELLQVAARLNSALAPLRAIASSERAPEIPPGLLRPRTATSRVRSNPMLRWLLVAALLLTIGGLSLWGVFGLAGLRQGAARAWQTSTSLQQINGISIASFSQPHADLRPLPLLPISLPGNTQAAFYGVMTDASNPDVMTVFVAAYRIDGRDVLLYEQPSASDWFSTSAQKVRIGERPGQVFQDDAGNYALQWYQDKMMCQITSKLPLTRLIQLADGFRPIKSWELLR